MPKVGNRQFDYTPAGMAEAEAYSEATGIPISDASERVQNYQWGGMITPPSPRRPAAPVAPRQPVAPLSPGLAGRGMYKKGGKVKKRKKGYKK